MTHGNLHISTPTDTTVVFTRTFSAPRHLVWQALTDPAMLRRWLFLPPGWSMTTCQFEPHVGGKYKWVWKNQTADPAMTIYGVVTEVVPHERLIHTQIMDMAETGPFEEFTVTVELTESRGTTHMRLTLTFPSTAIRDIALKWGMEHGMEAGYKQLDAMLVQPA